MLPLRAGSASGVSLAVAVVALVVSGAAVDAQLDGPVVDRADLPGGGGYWTTDSDGDVRSFGRAEFHGSLADLGVTTPVASIAATPSGHGYWLVTVNGRVFGFGDAPFLGNLEGRAVDDVVGLESTPSGSGYWIVRRDGRRTSRGSAPDTPRKAVLLGDSVALTLGPATRAGLESNLVEPISMNRVGFGFTADHPARYNGERLPAGFPDWRGELDQVVVEDDPDLFVVLVGAWDIVDREVGGAWRAPNDPLWRGWYDALLDDATRRMTAQGAFVAWVAMPCLDTAYAGLTDSANDAYRALAARRPDRVAFVDLESVVCPQGRFEKYITTPAGESHHLRLDDGLHFSIYTVAPALGDWFAEQFAALLVS